MVKRTQILPHLKNTLTETDFPFLGQKYRGKVRDNYTKGDKRTIIATDRQSAFDRNLGSIPLKGQALNQLSLWWFEKTADIIPNHIIESPDPNVVVCKLAKVFPVEMVIRGYLSGSTGTSAWVTYKKWLDTGKAGDCEYCGHILPDNLKKNDAFPTPLITPTTKSDTHDEKISRAQIIAQGMVPEEEYKIIEAATYKLFARGQELAKKAGLILVDTKYEFGKLEDGTIVLLDEIHTPDSSRFWKADTYETLITEGKEPDNFDKEFLRLWYTARCNPYDESVPLPEMPDDFRVEVAKRYIDCYELITGKEFELPEGDVNERIKKNLDKNLIK